MSTVELFYCSVQYYLCKHKSHGASTMKLYIHNVNTEDNICLYWRTETLLPVCENLQTVNYNGDV